MDALINKLAKEAAEKHALMGGMGYYGGRRGGFPMMYGRSRHGAFAMMDPMARQLWGMQAMQDMPNQGLGAARNYEQLQQGVGQENKLLEKGDTGVQTGLGRMSDIERGVTDEQRNLNKALGEQKSINQRVQDSAAVRANLGKSDWGEDWYKPSAWAGALGIAGNEGAEAYRKNLKDIEEAKLNVGTQKGLAQSQRELYKPELEYQSQRRSTMENRGLDRSDVAQQQQGARSTTGMSQAPVGGINPIGGQTNPGVAPPAAGGRRMPTPHLPKPPAAAPMKTPTASDHSLLGMTLEQLSRLSALNRLEKLAMPDYGGNKAMQSIHSQQMATLSRPRPKMNAFQQGAAQHGHDTAQSAKAPVSVAETLARMAAQKQGAYKRAMHNELGATAKLHAPAAGVGRAIHEHQMGTLTGPRTGQQVKSTPVPSTSRESVAETLARMAAKGHQQG